MRRDPKLPRRVELLQQEDLSMEFWGISASESTMSTFSSGVAARTTVASRSRVRRIFAS